MSYQDLRGKLADGGKLDVPEVDKEIEAVPTCDGACGPWWLRRSVRVELSVHFCDSCAAHDADYEEQSITRKQADKKFLSSMLQQAGDDRRLRRWAYIFYYSVRVGGIFSWGK